MKEYATPVERLQEQLRLANQLIFAMLSASGGMITVSDIDIARCDGTSKFCTVTRDERNCSVIIRLIEKPR